MLILVSIIIMDMYGIGFDRHGLFSHETGRNVMIFRVDMSSSTKIDNRKKDILVLVKDAT